MLYDAFFQQGDLHEVCEDYALAGDGYVILSDGCSNGGGPRIESDWGARILCKAAEQHVRQFRSGNLTGYLQSIADTAQFQCASFPNLPKESLTATLIVMLKLQEEIATLMIGDGVVAGKRKDGSWRICHYEFTKGGECNSAAPYYLKYEMDERDVERYYQLFGGNFKKSIYVGDLFSSLEKIEEEGVLSRPAPYQCFFRDVFPVKEFQTIFTCTDGVSAFYEQVQTQTSKYNKLIDLIEALKILLDVPTTSKHFLRLQRQWLFKGHHKQSLRARNWHTGDDVSIGAIHVP